MCETGTMIRAAVLTCGSVTIASRGVVSSQLGGDVNTACYFENRLICILEGVNELMHSIITNCCFMQVIVLYISRIHLNVFNELQFHIKVCTNPSLIRVFTYWKSHCELIEIGVWL